jgi:hypothetical protein
MGNHETPLSTYFHSQDLNKIHTKNDKAGKLVNNIMSEHTNTLAWIPYSVQMKDLYRLKTHITVKTCHLNTLKAYLQIKIMYKIPVYLF